MNYTACEELCSSAPEFSQSGVTEAVEASLKNNTGFNPSLSVLKTNEEDMETALDCLIGRLPLEMESYENCDWKGFLKDTLERLYTFLQANNASVAGAWEKSDCDCEAIGERLTALEGTAESHQSAIEGLEEDTAIIGTDTLVTTSQTLTGAVNEIVNNGLNAQTQTKQLTISSTYTNIAGDTTATLYLYKVGRLVYCSFVGQINVAAANASTAIAPAGFIPSEFQPEHISYNAVEAIQGYNVRGTGRIMYDINGAIQGEFSTAGNYEYHHNAMWLTA